MNLSHRESHPYREIRRARRLMKHVDSLDLFRSTDQTELYYLYYELRDMADRTYEIAKGLFIVFAAMNIPLVVVGILKSYLPYPYFAYGIVVVMYFASMAAMFWVRLGVCEGLRDRAKLLTVTSGSHFPS